MPPLIVTAAIIIDQDRILATRRLPGSRQGGLWEFPGGKLEEDETPEEALQRELREELGVQVAVDGIFDVIHHRYEWGAVLILAYTCCLLAGTIRDLQVAEHRWCTAEELSTLPFLAADRPLIAKLQSLAADREPAPGAPREALPCTAVSGETTATGDEAAYRLLDIIRTAESLDTLVAVRREVPAIARHLLTVHDSAGRIMDCLSQIHLAIMQRAFELCLTEHSAAAGPPPVRYCFTVLGSAARREMLLAPDQDHALLYEALDDDGLAEAERFFAPLAAELVAALEKIGYPRCDGRIMADNPAWRGRLEDWQKRVRTWVAQSDPQQVRDSSIFFDHAPLVGDHALCSELGALAREEIRGQSAFLHQMMCLDLSGRVPLGLLGRFITERGGPHAGELSLKLGGMLYLVDCVRVFALDKGVSAIATLDRLQGLAAAHVFDGETAGKIAAAFEILALLRLHREIGQAEAGDTPGHYINPKSYGKIEQEQLKEALQTVSRLQESTRRFFARTPF